jgi:hypothetical protein
MKSHTVSILCAGKSATPVAFAVSLRKLVQAPEIFPMPILIAALLLIEGQSLVEEDIAKGRGWGDAAELS